jgi:hypothetical protein
VTTSQSNLPAVDQSLEAHAQGLPGKVFKPGALTILVALGCGAIVAWGGIALAQAKFTAVEDRAAARADAGAAAVAAKLEQHVRDEQAARDAQARFNERLLDAMQGMEDRNARRFDALQNTVVERRVQPESAELARPAALKDGGR